MSTGLGAIWNEVRCYAEWNGICGQRGKVGRTEDRVDADSDTAHFRVLACGDTSDDIDEFEERTCAYLVAGGGGGGLGAWEVWV